MEINPTNTILSLSFGGTCERLTNWDGAIDCYNRAIELEPRNADFYFTRSIPECAKGDWASALSDMNRFFQLDQFGHTQTDGTFDKWNKSFIYARRGWIKVQLEQFSSATVDASRAMFYWPSNDFAYYIRASARLGRGDTLGAIEDCKTALKYYDRDKPDEPEFTSREQGLLFFMTEDYRNAIASWNKAIDLSHQVDEAELQPWIERAEELSKAKSDSQQGDSSNNDSIQQIKFILGSITKIALNFGSPDGKNNA